MYAIALDLEIAELKKCYGDPYNGAYQEIGKELKLLGFDWAQGSVCLSHNPENNLANVYKAINRLSRIDWFVRSVRDIRAFKVEDWSDFTAIVKENGLGKDSSSYSTMEKQTRKPTAKQQLAYALPAVKPCL